MYLEKVKKEKEIEKKNEDNPDKAFLPPVPNTSLP